MFPADEIRNSLAMPVFQAALPPTGASKWQGTNTIPYLHPAYLKKLARRQIPGQRRNVAKVYDGSIPFDQWLNLPSTGYSAMLNLKDLLVNNSTKTHTYLSGIGAPCTDAVKGHMAGQTMAMMPAGVLRELFTRFRSNTLWGEVELRKYIHTIFAFLDITNNTETHASSLKEIILNCSHPDHICNNIIAHFYSLTDKRKIKRVYRLILRKYCYKQFKKIVLNNQYSKEFLFSYCTGFLYRLQLLPREYMHQGDEARYHPLRDLLVFFRRTISFYPRFSENYFYDTISDFFRNKTADFQALHVSFICHWIISRSDPNAVFGDLFAAIRSYAMDARIQVKIEPEALEELHKQAPGVSPVSLFKKLKPFVSASVSTERAICMSGDPEPADGDNLDRQIDFQPGLYFSPTPTMEEVKAPRPCTLKVVAPSTENPASKLLTLYDGTVPFEDWLGLPTTTYSVLSTVEGLLSGNKEERDTYLRELGKPAGDETWGKVIGQITAESPLARLREIYVRYKSEPHSFYNQRYRSDVRKFLGLFHIHPYSRPDTYRIKQIMDQCPTVEMFIDETTAGLWGSMHKYQTSPEYGEAVLRLCYNQYYSFLLEKKYSPAFLASFWTGVLNRVPQMVRTDRYWLDESYPRYLVGISVFYSRIIFENRQFVTRYFPITLRAFLSNRPYSMEWHHRLYVKQRIYSEAIHNSPLMTVVDELLAYEVEAGITIYVHPVRIKKIYAELPFKPIQWANAQLDPVLGIAIR